MRIKGKEGGAYLECLFLIFHKATSNFLAYVGCVGAI